MVDEFLPLSLLLFENLGLVKWRMLQAMTWQDFN
jgi:hypothetical protein